MYSSPNTLLFDSSKLIQNKYLVFARSEVINIGLHQVYCRINPNPWLRKHAWGNLLLAMEY